MPRALGNTEDRCALCAGDFSGTVEVGVQRGEAGGRGTSPKRRQGLIRQGSGDGEEGRG